MEIQGTAPEPQLPPRFPSQRKTRQRTGWRCKGCVWEVKKVVLGCTNRRQAVILRLDRKSPRHVCVNKLKNEREKKEFLLGGGWWYTNLKEFAKFSPAHQQVIKQHQTTLSRLQRVQHTRVADLSSKRRQWRRRCHYWRSDFPAAVEVIASVRTRVCVAQTRQETGTSAVATRTLHPCSPSLSRSPHCPYPPPVPSTPALPLVEITPLPVPATRHAEFVSVQPARHLLIHPLHRLVGRRSKKGAVERAVSGNLWARNPKKWLATKGKTVSLVTTKAMVTSATRRRSTKQAMVQAPQQCDRFVPCGDLLWRPAPPPPPQFVQ